MKNNQNSLESKFSQDRPIILSKKRESNEHSSIACEPCRSKKRKCDRKSPCSSCIEAKQECHYRDAFRRGPSAGWSQLCLERALEVENALKFVLGSQNVQNVLLDQYKKEGGFILPNVIDTREQSQLTKEWSKNPIRTMNDLSRFANRIQARESNSSSVGRMVNSNGSLAQNLAHHSKNQLQNDLINVEVENDEDFW